ncbi:MAG: transposase [Ruminococcus sp.]|nr:transposase [Ruminococcus sp.]
MQFQKRHRKPNRLKKYDYSQNGSYFLTICSYERQYLFWEKESTLYPHKDQKLSEIGRIVESSILNIEKHYQNIRVDNYVIMPNHVHMILTIQRSIDFKMICSSATNVSNVINKFKGYASKKAGMTIWQKSYHDHIIRNEKDYLKIWEYIDNNPYRWKEDCLFCL